MWSQRVLKHGLWPADDKSEVMGARTRAACPILAQPQYWREADATIERRGEEEVEVRRMNAIMDKHETSRPGGEEN